MNLEEVLALKQVISDAEATLREAKYAYNKARREVKFMTPTYRIVEVLGVKIEGSFGRPICDSCGCTDFPTDAIKFRLTLTQASRDALNEFNKAWGQSTHVNEIFSQRIRWVRSTTDISIGLLHEFGSGYAMFCDAFTNRTGVICSVEQWETLKSGEFSTGLKINTEFRKLLGKTEVET